MMKDEFFHDTNGLLISRARERASEFAPIFCFKARYIVKKEGGVKKKKNDRGRKTVPMTREWKERREKFKRKSVKQIIFSRSFANLRSKKKKVKRAHSESPFPFRISPPPVK